jgi:hypothetical protein
LERSLRLCGILGTKICPSPVSYFQSSPTPLERPPKSTVDTEPSLPRQGEIGSREGVLRSRLGIGWQSGQEMARVTTCRRRRGPRPVGLPIFCLGPNSSLHGHGVACYSTHLIGLDPVAKSLRESLQKANQDVVAVRGAYVCPPRYCPYHFRYFESSPLNNTTAS